MRDADLLEHPSPDGPDPDVPDQNPTLSRRGIRTLRSDRSSGGAKCLPAAIKLFLQDALALRDRWRAAAISPRGLTIARGRLEGRLDNLLARPPTNPVNRRFFDHVTRHRSEILPFLYDDELHATNWRAEQALRPAVVNRKVFGGNRTPAGAHALETFASLFAPCRQHGQNALDYLSKLLRLPPALDPMTVPLPLPV